MSESGYIPYLAAQQAVLLKSAATQRDAPPADNRPAAVAPSVRAAQASAADRQGVLDEQSARRADRAKLLRLYEQWAQEFDAAADAESDPQFKAAHRAAAAELRQRARSYAQGPDRPQATPTPTWGSERVAPGGAAGTAAKAAWATFEHRAMLAEEAQSSDARSQWRSQAREALNKALSGSTVRSLNKGAAAAPFGGSAGVNRVAEYRAKALDWSLDPTVRMAYEALARQAEGAGK